jgi:hypothetical protein
MIPCGLLARSDHRLKPVAGLTMRARRPLNRLGSFAPHPRGLETTLEFRRPGTFAPLGDLVGGGPFDLPAGAWTDDTSMALCLAESLVECGGFDPVDQLERYVRWYRHGHLASTGRCVDIGNTVRAALERFERTREPSCGSTAPETAGNGSLMRLAPVALAWARRPRDAVRLAADSSRTTHAAREAVDACRYLSALLVGALQGVPKDDLLAGPFDRSRASGPRRRSRRASPRSRRAPSRGGARPRSAAAATSSSRRRRRCGPSIGAPPSGRAPSSP